MRSLQRRLLHLRLRRLSHSLRGRRDRRLDVVRRAPPNALLLAHWLEALATGPVIGVLGCSPRTLPDNTLLHTSASIG